MKKEQLQNLAKEFCEKEGIERTDLIDNGIMCETVECVLSKFLQSMIDQREVAGPQEILSIAKRINDLEKEVQHYRDLHAPGESTVSSAGKEVKTAVLVQNNNELIEVLSYNDYLGYVPGCGGKISTDIERKYPIVVPIEQSYWIKDDLAKCIRLYNVIPISRIQFKSPPACTGFGYAPEWVKDYFAPTTKVEGNNMEFTEFIKTTGLSQKDQDLIKGVYFGWIKQEEDNETKPYTSTPEV